MGNAVKKFWFIILSIFWELYRIPPDITGFPLSHSVMPGMYSTFNQRHLRSSEAEAAIVKTPFYDLFARFPECMQRFPACMTKKPNKYIGVWHTYYASIFCGFLGADPHKLKNIAYSFARFEEVIGNWHVNVMNSVRSDFF